METKDELKEIDIENCTCFYFDDVMRAIDIDFSDISLMKDDVKYTKTFWFITFHAKPLWVSNHWEFGLII